MGDKVCLCRGALVLCFVMASLVTSTLRAQTLHGHVSDEEGTPLEFVCMALLSQQDSTVLTGCVTQADGNWSLSLVDALSARP